MHTSTDVIVSQHTTSDGVVVWSRCACGRLQMVLAPYRVDGKRLAAGGHGIQCPHRSRS